MKETFQKEYLRRARLVLQSQINDCNKIKSINTYAAVSLICRGESIIAQKKDDLPNLNRHACKLMIMNKNFNPKSDICRACVCRKNDRMGLEILEAVLGLTKKILLNMLGIALKIFLK